MKETKFKQTEVGMIPSDWEETYLGNIGPVKMCKRVMKYQTSEKGDIPFYKIGTFGKSPDAYISKDLYHYLKNKYSFPQKGTVLISAAGTIGRTVVYDGKDAFFQDSNIIWLENDESVLTNQYLYYLYQVVEWKTENGGAVSRLYNDNFKITPIAIPSSKKEQQRIANALSDVDSLIANLEKLIAKKKNIKQGAMQQLLTGRKRLPGFAPAKPTYKQTELGKIPTDWEVKKIGEFCSVKDGTHGTYARHDKGCLLLSAKNILDNCLQITNDESFISEKDYAEITANGYPRKGDILVSCVGSIGRCCILETDERIAFQRSVAFVRNKSANNRFLMYAIQGESAQVQLEESKNASTLGGVYLSALADIELMLPASLDEQTAIANVLSDMDTEISALETKLAKYRQLKTGIMQQLLTGKIRLV